MTRSIKQKRIFRAKRSNNRIPLYKIQPMCRYVHKTINRFYKTIVVSENVGTWNSELIDWFEFLNNSDSQVHKVFPFMNHYKGVVVEKVTLVIKNIKVQVLREESRVRDRLGKLVSNPEKTELKAQYLSLTGYTDLTDLTKKNEEMRYYWTGNNVTGDTGEVIDDNKDMWNIKKLRITPKAIIKRTFLAKSKSALLSDYDKNCNNEDGPTISALLKKVATPDKTIYPCLYVMPELDYRYAGAKIYEKIRYVLNADICIYIHLKFCKRTLDGR